SLINRGAGEGVVDGGADLGDGLGGAARERAPAEESVVQARPGDEGDRDAGGAEPRGVPFGLGPQPVGLGGGDDRRGQAAGVGVQQRRDVGVGGVGAVQVGAQGAAGLGRREAQAVGVGERRGDAAQVQRRVEQHLQGGPRGPGGAQPARRGGGDLPAGAVAGDADAGGVQAERGGAGGDPADGGDGVVDGGGVGVLGRAAVPDRHPGDAAGPCQRPHDRVVGVDVAEDPAAAVEVDQGGRGTAGGGGAGGGKVQAGGQRPGGAVHAEVLHRADREAGGAGQVGGVRAARGGDGAAGLRGRGQA